MPADPPDLARGFYLEPKPKVPDEIANPVDDSVIIIDADTTDSDPQLVDGALKIESSDGTVTIDLSPIIGTGDGKGGSLDDDFDGNLADYIDEAERQRILSEVLQAIESDEQSRKEWLETRAKGIDMLGFKLEEPRGDTGASTAPVEGMSTVRHPLLPEAVIRFQSNAAAELLPPSGPCKVRSDSPSAPPTDTSGATMPGATPAAAGHNGGPPLDDEEAVQPPAGTDNDDLAEALEKDFNHYLTVVDKGYRADTDRMLFLVGFGGCGFKKVYSDPIRRMPLSRSVDAADLIVSNAANDIDDAGRVTHRIFMRKSTLIRMQLAGVYRKLDNLSQPYQQLNPVDIKIMAIQGFNPMPIRPEDHLYTIYESYVELDIQGFEHTDKEEKATGLQLPYRVTIEKDSRQLLEIRRNWKKDDENCLAKKVFVKYPFIPALGFYDIGLLNILGNANRALTAAWREMLDSGMFANFPGFLYADTAGRQATNEFRIPPGGGMKIATGGKNIGDVVMRLPYNDVTPGLAQLVQNVEATAKAAGGTAEMQVGEGKQDAPVGTTLALIEQATKMLAAVHVRLHAAQAEEFQLLKERFREDPEAFWRQTRRPSKPWDAQMFLAALDNNDIVPAADPNTPSHMHRVMKAMAIGQMVQLMPMLFDPKAVASRIMRMLGIPDPNSLFAAPGSQPGGDQQPPVDPSKMASVQLKQQQMQQEAAQHEQERQDEANSQAQENDSRMKEVALESQDRAADRASREKVAQIREDTQRMKTEADTQREQQQLQQQQVQHDQQMAHQVQSDQLQHEQHIQQSQQQHEQGMQQHAMKQEETQQKPNEGLGAPPI